jgi:hypothetical protein
VKLLFVLVIAFGALKVVRPGTGKSLERWQWRNSRDLEPSAAYNVVSRVMGVIMILVGLFGLRGGFTGGY